MKLAAGGAAAQTSKLDDIPAAYQYTKETVLHNQM